MKKTAVFCIAKNQDQADRIVSKLHNAGLHEISVLWADKTTKTTTRPDSNFRADSTIRDTNIDLDDENAQKDFRPKTGGVAHEKHTKAAEGAAIAGTAGGVVGGTLGLLAGIGALAIPGLGPFIAAGPIMAALSGSAVGGSLGLLLGSLVGIGIPEYQAKYYQDIVTKGAGTLISVEAKTSEQIDQVKDIFKKEGAQDIATTSAEETPAKKR